MKKTIKNGTLKETISEMGKRGFVLWSFAFNYKRGTIETEWQKAGRKIPTQQNLFEDNERNAAI